MIVRALTGIDDHEWDDGDVYGGGDDNELGE
jgi:hypothetical protein